MRAVSTKLWIGIAGAAGSVIGICIVLIIQAVISPLSHEAKIQKAGSDESLACKTTTIKDKKKEKKIRDQHFSSNKNMNSCNYFERCYMGRCLLVDSPVYAESALNFDHPKQWSDEWKKTSKDSIFRPGNAAGIFSFIVVKREKSGFSIIPMPRVASSGVGGLRSPTEEQIDRTLEANITNPASEENLVNPCLTTLEKIGECFQVDSVLDVTSEIWNFYFYNKLTQKTSVIVSSAKAARNDLAGMWIHRMLNYDGVIVDLRGRKVLAIVPGDSIKEGDQALTFAESYSQLKIPLDRSTDGGLLQLIERDGDFVVFKIPVKSASLTHFIPGTKFKIWSVNEFRNSLSH